MPCSRAFVSLLAIVSTLAAVSAQDFQSIPFGSLVPDYGAPWRSVAAGDLDGDGDLDLVYACYGTPPVGTRNYQLRNDGGGWFSAGPIIGLAPSLSRAVLLGDFDGDGDLDAFFGNQQVDAICRNDGTGHLALSPGDLPPLNRETFAAAAGDVDGDGDLDIVCACGGFDVLYRNNGNGVFVDASANLPGVWDLTVDVDLGDYDGDGDLDVLLATKDNTSQLLWNDGTGVFVAGPTLPPAAAVTGGDVDGDGDRDFVLTAYAVAFPFGAVHANRLFVSDGAGGFVSSALPSTAFWGAFRPGGLADLDGDGDLDLALAGEGLLVNDGAGGFAAITTPLPWYGRHFADIDADGDLDMIGEPTLRNDGSGNFPQAAAAALLTQGEVVAIADVDGDGDLDLLQQQIFQLAVLDNDGRGTFRPSGVTVANNTWPDQPWLTADWTGDGFVDLMPRYGSAFFASVNGTGFVSAPLPETFYETVSFDADGDGDLDFVAQRFNGTVSWYANNGGTFAAGVPTPLGTVGTLLGAGDVDGDGRDDLLYTTATQQLAWARCSGIGVLTAMVHTLPANLPTASAAVTADLDGDGALEIVVGHSGVASQRVTVLRDNGNGQMVVAVALEMPQLQTVGALLAADFDGDLDLDLIVQQGPFSSQAARCLRNDGAWSMVDVTGDGTAWRGLNAPIGADLLVGDLDRDGDLDLVATNSERTELLSNLRHQLIAREQLTRGAVWRLEVVQRPVGSSLGAVLVGGVELQPAVATPFGELRVDPSSGAVFGGVLVVAYEPNEVFALAVPNLPALAGVVFYAQHVVVDGGGIRLGNQLRGIVQ